MSHPLLGKPAPDFELVNQHGRPVKLSELRGKPVLIVFVPFAFSELCSSEITELRDAMDIDGLGDVTPLIISCDSVYSLKSWANKHDYLGDVLSDFWPHGDVAREYGVFNPQKGLATRGSFLVDHEGVVRWSVVNPPGEVRQTQSYFDAIAALS